MNVQEVEALARGTARTHAFMVIDLTPRPGANHRTEALAEFGERFAERLGSGPIAFHFTDRQDAEDTYRRTLVGLRADLEAVDGEIALVTSDATRVDRINRPD